MSLHAIEREPMGMFDDQLEVITVSAAADTVITSSWSSNMPIGSRTMARRDMGETAESRCG